MVPKHGPRGHSDACRSRSERIWADQEAIKATAKAEKDVRLVQLECNENGESVGDPTSEWDVSKFKSTSSSGKFISDEQCTRRPSSSTSVYVVSAKQD